MRFLLTAAATAALLSAAAPASAADRVVAGLGTAKVAGKTATVEVFVAVPDGTSAKAAKDRAIRAQGATPVANEFTFTGLKWDVLPVRQNYNPAGQPVNGASGALRHVLAVEHASPAPRSASSRAGRPPAARRSSGSAPARSATTASTTSAGRGSPTARSA